MYFIHSKKKNYHHLFLFSDFLPGGLLWYLSPCLWCLVEPLYCWETTTRGNHLHHICWKWLQTHSYEVGCDFLFTWNNFTLVRREILLTSRKHTYIILTPLNSTFYIVKLGFTGVCIIFHISAQKYRLWALIRTASGKTASVRQF